MAAAGAQETALSRFDRLSADVAGPRAQDQQGCLANNPCQFCVDDNRRLSSKTTPATNQQDRPNITLRLCTSHHLIQLPLPPSARYHIDFHSPKNLVGEARCQRSRCTPHLAQAAKGTTAVPKPAFCRRPIGPKTRVWRAYNSTCTNSTTSRHIAHSQLDRFWHARFPLPTIIATGAATPQSIKVALEACILFSLRSHRGRPCDCEQKLS